MMIGERASWRVAGIAILGLAVVALVIAWNPAMLPERWIQRWIEQKLPAGSSIVAVRQTIEAEEWTTVGEQVYGDSSTVSVHIGNSRIPRRFVYADFTFDRFGRLLGIRVTKRQTPPDQRPSTVP
jgi:hypothetical protein